MSMSPRDYQRLYPTIRRYGYPPPRRGLADLVRDHDVELEQLRATLADLDRRLADAEQNAQLAVERLSFMGELGI